MPRHGRQAHRGAGVTDRQRREVGLEVGVLSIEQLAAHDAHPGHPRIIDRKALLMQSLDRLHDAGLRALCPDAPAGANRHPAIECRCPILRCVRAGNDPPPEVVALNVVIEAHFRAVLHLRLVEQLVGLADHPERPLLLRREGVVCRPASVRGSFDHIVSEAHVLTAGKQLPGRTDAGIVHLADLEISPFQHRPFVLHAPLYEVPDLLFEPSLLFDEWVYLAPQVVGVLPQPVEAALHAVFDLRLP